MTDPIASLRARIEAMEEAYEYFLAYAAQGRSGDDPSVPIRAYLQRADAALDGLAGLLDELVDDKRLEPAPEQRAFARVVEEDASKAMTAIRLALGQPSISSQLIDNLNASIHLRALLTDLFLIDETVKTRQPS